MDFFEAQARAKKRTTRLVVLFVLAVLGTIAAAYFAAVLGLGALDRQNAAGQSSRYDSVYSDASGSAADSLWQPGLFAGVAFATLAVVGIASLVKWAEFSSGGSAVAESVGGRRVDPHTTDLHERRLLNVVEEMAIASGTPVPAVYILDDEPALNAFAAGLTTSDAVVTVTRGTLEKLTRDELQGVVGHEFSHILNGDMRLNLRLTALLFGILVLGLAGRGVLWSLSLGRGRSRDSKNSGGVVVAILAIGVALLIIGYVGYFFGRLIQAAVSRQREFLADASSVQFTRNPAGLTGALKKIGGCALGSSLETHKAAAIGHFFFAQAFQADFAGLWATHPPLPDRLRAIDPLWDGQMFAAPETVDVARESFVQAGLAAAPIPHPGTQNLPPVLAGLIPGTQNPKSGTSSAAAALAAVAAIGTLTPDQISNAQSLLDRTPEPLRIAARSPDTAQALLFGLLLDGDPAVRARQRALLSADSARSPEVGGAPPPRLPASLLGTLDQLEPSLRTLDPAQKFPLLQLALPALRQIPPAALTPFLEKLQALILADGRVTPFEFALQKILTRSLALGRKPTDAAVQIYSFNAVVDEISVILSALAHAATTDATFAAQAFAAGAAQLKLIETRLHFLPDTADLTALDAALDKLATASGPIKQRTLTAAAQVVSADGQILVPEAELLRAISAALDCPMPPLAAGSMASP